MGIGQSSVQIEMASVFPGQAYLSGPHRAQPGTINSSGATYPNYVGYAYTQVAGQEGFCTLGGSGDFFGILMNPQNFPLYGSASGALAPSLAMPQYAPGEFAYEHTGLGVMVSANANIGDLVDYNITTGAIVTRPPTVSFTGAVTSNVLTVSAVTAGSAPIQVGSVFNTPGGVMEIISLGTGTGGTGTYNVDDVANFTSAAIAGNSAPVAGNKNIDKWKVVRFNVTYSSTPVAAVIGTKVS